MTRLLAFRAKHAGSIQDVCGGIAITVFCCFLVVAFA